MLVTATTRACAIAADCLAVGVTWFTLTTRHDLRQFGGLKSTIASVLLIDGECWMLYAPIRLSLKSNGVMKFRDRLLPVSGVPSQSRGTHTHVPSSILLILNVLHITFTLLSVSLKPFRILTLRY